MPASEAQKAASRRYYYRNKRKITEARKKLRDLNKYTYIVESEINGELVTFYSIKYLAHELGVKNDTIRKWEYKGIIPKTPYTDSRGCRLYSQAIIDLLKHNYQLFKNGDYKNLKDFGHGTKKAWKEARELGLF